MSEKKLEEALSNLSAQLVELAQKQGVIGQPTTIGDTTVMPLSEIRLSFGGFGGEGEGESDDKSPERGRGKATMGFGAGGVKVVPMALVVVSGDEVRFETFEDEGGAK